MWATFKGVIMSKIEKLAERITSKMVLDICKLDYDKIIKLEDKKELSKFAYSYTKNYITAYDIKIDIVKLTNKVLKEYRKLAE